MKKFYMPVFLVGSLLLAACGPQKQPTPEEFLLLEAQKDCEKDATNITDPPHNSNGLAWNAYFTMCMKTRYGYTQEDLKKLWY